ncbi:hypothetical protein ACQP2K_19775 [Microbispora siamensis]
MSSTLSLRAWAIFLLVVAADWLDLLSTTVTNVAAPTIVSTTVYLATVTPGEPSSGVLPCLLLTLAITAACAMSIPLLPRRGALAH